jgi:hypothetical protein
LTPKKRPGPPLREWAWKSLHRDSIQFAIREGGLLFRNTHFALYLLSDASKDCKSARANA